MCFTKRHVFKKMSTVEELKNDCIKQKTDLPSKRSQLKICVLDNDGFNSEELRKIGYTNIAVRESFDSINDFKEFDLVLCDVDGIGTKYNPQKQGLAVAEEIVKSFFPMTQVVIYTGKELSDYEYEEIEGVSVIRKNLSNAELVKEIDEICSIFWKPEAMWSFLEKYYRKEKLPNKEIALLEDLFVKSNLNQDKYYIQDQTNKINWQKYNDFVSTGLHLSVRLLSILYENN